MTAPTTLRAQHDPRPVRFGGLHQLGDWRVKLYTIATAGSAARPELVDAALAKAGEALPEAATDDGRHGVGFVIAHDAADFCFVLVDWWQGDNELHQHLFTAQLDDPTHIVPYAGNAIGCVWELGATDFERRAWIADVLANPAGPDIELYLSRELNDDI